MTKNQTIGTKSKRKNSKESEEKNKLRKGKSKE
jgi:hypothetical protein